MKRIEVWRDPHGRGFSTTRAREVVFEPGLTVLVGCNGAGKSTLLRNLMESLRESRDPYVFYDDKTDGGSNSLSRLIYSGDTSFAAGMLGSSEGERIRMNVAWLLGGMREFLKTGDPPDLVMRASDPDVVDTVSFDAERWLLLDAVDSGYSIDNVVDLKELFSLMFDDAREMGVELYVVVSANGYEMAAGEDCIDVLSGKHVSFGSYDEYKCFVMRTKDRKVAREIRAAEKEKEKNKKKKGKEGTAGRFVASAPEIVIGAVRGNREMLYEEKKELRKQIGQLLADAGLNQGTLKAMVETEIKNKVDRALEQVLRQLDAQSSSGDYLKERIHTYLEKEYLKSYACTEAVKNELKDRVIQVVLKGAEVGE